MGLISARENDQASRASFEAKSRNMLPMAVLPSLATEGRRPKNLRRSAPAVMTVSYTHLTLPTIA